MPSSNPLFHGKWTLDKFKATVLNDIWPEITYFTAIAAMVTLVSKLTEHQLSVGSSLLTVLGTVLGLVISFRTTSAYERYQEGRKLWSNIMMASKNLALMIWLHVPTERNNNKDPQDPLKSTIEKKTMINLIQAFSVSVKHFLRGEPGVYYKDLFPLISFLPRYVNKDSRVIDMLPLWAACNGEYVLPHHEPENPRAAVDRLQGLQGRQHTNSLPATFNGVSNDEEKILQLESSREPSPEKEIDLGQALPRIDCHRPLKAERIPPKSTIYDHVPMFRIFRWFARTLQSKKGRRETDSPTWESEEKIRLRSQLEMAESNVPLEILLVLSSYTNYLMRIPDGHLQPAIATGMTNAIISLQDTLSNLERIRNTPLPFAYQAHLRISVWFYLLFLPFQVYSNLGWYTIPGTAFASLLFLGFLEIGQEIENPFHYDLNDLDLDHFCLSLQRELHEVTAFTNFDPKSYIFSPWNKPFAPSDQRTAAVLMEGRDTNYLDAADAEGILNPGLDSIRRTLVKNWNTVDEVTRRVYGK